MVRPFSRKTSYELFKGKSPSIINFKVFDTKCFIHINDKRNTDKFEDKSEPEIFLRYLATSRAYRIYNSKHDCIEESPHVIFDEITDNHPYRDEDEGEFIKENTEQKDDEEETKSEDQRIKPRIQGEETITLGTIINVLEHRNHPLDRIIGNLHDLPRTRSHFKMTEEMNSLTLVSQIEPKDTESTLNDKFE